jgi:formylglycine-generating enzyme required for sulfatase activity
MMMTHSIKQLYTLLKITISSILLCYVFIPESLSGYQHSVITNSAGMELVLIHPGSYERGSETSNQILFFDERPVHTVHISQPFYMSSTPVTNEQFEQFDPDHIQYRGNRGFSTEDDEAVVFVSWEDAVAYTEWLSEKEGETYRLPTEAEWEFAARAGTTTPFFTGDELPEEFHRHQVDETRPVPVPLHVGQTPPNPWGLHDIHGLVEEWTLDWYGPYTEGDQTDPVGYEDGEIKVTRGGSHNTNVRYLRSANRMGTVPDNKHWLIGFRVVKGELPDTTPLPRPESPEWAKNVSRDSFEWENDPASDTPYFKAPVPYIHMPDEPPYNEFMAHCPSITLLANGDLLAVWHAMNNERGRELAIAGARLRAGESEWDTASEFFRAPGRNLHGPDLFTDDDGTVYYFNGLSASAEIHHILGMVMRKSTDHGTTWSKPRMIGPEHHSRHQVIDGSFKTRDGALVVTADSNPGGTALHISRDGGESWTDPGGTIRGIHAGVTELEDGRLMAIGRGQNIDGRSPMSISDDMGESWEYSASPFPPIGSGQRPVLLRLDEGPILFISFTDDRNEPRGRGLMFEDKDGNEFRGHGLYAALSYDEGESWPVRKLITPADGKIYHARHIREPSAPFRATYDNAEYQGYLAATQAPNGIIHLISSRLHYQFNLAWLLEQPNLSDTGRTSPYIEAVKTFSDHVLKYGRDRYGDIHSPLFIDGFSNLEAKEPIRWEHEQGEWIVSNFGSQQNLIRVLVGLSELTGELKYRDAAEETTRYMFEHHTDSQGLLYWGGHQFVDLKSMQNQFKGRPHELKNNFPFYEFFWEVNPEATKRLLRAMWNAHILDWNVLDLNRHGEYDRDMGRLWDHEFSQPDPFFEGIGLTFINAGTDMIQAAIALYGLAGEEGAREWGMRLYEQYVRARHPETGLGVYQYSQPLQRDIPPAEGPLTGTLTWSNYGDRAQNQFGSVYGEIALEGNALWGGRISRIYGQSAVMMLHLAEELADTEDGDIILEWTLDGLRAIAEHAYVPEENHFRPMWADGTDLTGHIIPRTGYYGSEGSQITPFTPDGPMVLSYARAVRLSEGDPMLWNVIRHIFIDRDLGDPGPDVETDPELNLSTNQSDPGILVAILELYRTTGHHHYLELAERIGQNILQDRYHDGYFSADPDANTVRFDDPAPLALLMLEATLQGRPEIIPPYLTGTGSLDP